MQSEDQVTANNPAQEPERRTSRREAVKAGAAIAVGVVAAGYVKPTLRGLGVPAALAQSGSPPPPPPPPPTTNYCVGMYTPGWWKNYRNHYTDTAYYALLKATVDFGSWFTSLGQSTAISTAVTILNLTGNHNVRSLLSAELAVAAMPSMGTAMFTPVGASSPSTVNSLLSKAYTDNGGNGGGNRSPWTNGPGWTAADNDIAQYVGNGGGEKASASSCRVR